MKKIYTILIALTVLLSVSSCNDFLGNKPKGYMIPQYFEDYAVLLNNYSFGFFGVLYPAYMTDDIVLGGETGFPNYVTLSSKTESEQGCFTFKKGDIFPKGSNDWFYVDAYSYIYVYNVVVNNILNVPDGSDADKRRVWAEALTHRAFIYLQLVNVYARHYDKNTATTDYGVPIVLSEDINNTYTMNSVQEVYDLIIKDLNDAFDYLAEATPNPYHPNKTTAYGLLARAYLYMGEYDLALENAKLALKHNKSASFTDYKKYEARGEDYWSRILDADGNAFPQRGDNPESMYLKLPPNDFSSYVFASEDLIRTFSMDLPAGAIDKRFEMFYAKDRANTFEDMVFPGYTMYVAHVMPNVGVSLQEIYLILAECEARSAKGTAAQATAYLDVLRNNRIVNNTSLVASSKEEALRMALNERRREMAFWGHMRYIDLKRLNKEAAFAKTVEHTLEGVTYSLPANDNRWIMPLPHSVREFNPSLPLYDRN